MTEQKIAEWQLHQKTLELQQQNDELRTANEQISHINATLTETIHELELSQKKYALLFNTISYGFAYHKIITDEQGAPIDYEFININNAFERLTGLTQEEVIGKTVKQVLPQTEAFWIEMFGRVALDGETCEFDHYSEALDKHFKVKSYSPEKGYFVAVFEEISYS